MQSLQMWLLKLPAIYLLFVWVKNSLLICLQKNLFNLAQSWAAYVQGKNKKICWDFSNSGWRSFQDQSLVSFQVGLLLDKHHSFPYNVNYLLEINVLVLFYVLPFT